MGVPELRRLVLHHCDTLQALLAFNFNYTDENRAKIEGIRSAVDAASAKRLRAWRDELRFNIEEISNAVGCIADLDWLIQACKAASEAQEGTFLLPKWYIDKTLFRRFGGATAISSIKLPPHTLIWLDFDAHNAPGSVDWVLPEAALYEDMVIAYNNAVKTSARPAPGDRESGKTHTFFVRQAVLCAFYFVEAYLNGIAFDYCHLHTGLPPDVSATLLELDLATGKERWVNFRAKLLQYPKLISGQQHPPLTESNCDALRVLVTTAKDIRDALVHQSPKLELSAPGKRFEMPKVSAFINLRLPDATTIVDAAVELVRRINDVIGKEGTSLSWLHDRDNEGMFPKKALY